MRFFRLLFQDMRYQFTYGFYFLYLILSVLYICILLLVPDAIRRQAAALFIWSDPAALGFFFVGGIVLLEKGEGLLNYLWVTPVTPAEYVLAKTLSLSVISVLAGLTISAFGLGNGVNYPLLAVALLTGCSTFTLFGLAVGSRARSVNHYFALGLPVGLGLMAPALAVLLGVKHPVLEVLPSTLLLRLLYAALGLNAHYSTILIVTGLALWSCWGFFVVRSQFTSYLQYRGVFLE